VALGQATLEWLVNQNAAIGSFETGDELFRVAIDEAFSVAANGLEDVAPMCQIVEEVFPYFYNTIAMDPDGSLARCFE
jgi:hypothetical protein